MARDLLRFHPCCTKRSWRRFNSHPARSEISTLFEGQSAGVNTGPEKLPFPTREETILPWQLLGPFENTVRQDGSGFVFRYTSSDGQLVYRFDPAQGLSGIVAEFTTTNAPADGQRLKPLDGAAIRLEPSAAPTLVSARLNDRIVTAAYADGTTLQLQLWQKSLVCDVINRGARATELQFGQVTGAQNPRTVWVPFLTYGGGAHPSVLLSGSAAAPVFTSVWLETGTDPMGRSPTPRSPSGQTALASMAAFATTRGRTASAIRCLNGSSSPSRPALKRFCRTCLTRWDCTPASGWPLWQESWGPTDFEQQMKRSRMLRAYGIKQLIQCNHEIAWRDGGESFTLRLRAAPKKGGDDALKRYVAHQRGLGWLAGLYSNYTDYAPVNEFWSPDGVQRQSDGSWRSAWPRCYAEKPLKAVEFDALLAPQIKAKFDPNSAYTDVHTAVSPWGYTDYDARVPGAGTFAQTFYAYGEILRNDSRVYGGPIFSEGTYHWLYAGLADGNYALAYNGRPLATAPLLPVFDLYQIHTKECDIGMGWTANFCDAIPELAQAGESRPGHRPFSAAHAGLRTHRLAGRRGAWPRPNVPLLLHAPAGASPLWIAGAPGHLLLDRLKPGRALRGHCPGPAPDPPPAPHRLSRPTKAVAE